MSDTSFDAALIFAAFRLAGQDGWSRVSAAAAARAAGLSVAEARARFPSRSSILLRFGLLADQTALQDAPTEGPARDRLFDLLMRRIDVLQAHRAGVKALLRALPADPATALLLACANQAEHALDVAGGRHRRDRGARGSADPRAAGGLAVGGQGMGPGRIRRIFPARWRPSTRRCSGRSGWHPGCTISLRRRLRLRSLPVRASLIRLLRRQPKILRCLKPKRERVAAGTFRCRHGSGRAGW